MPVFGRYPSFGSPVPSGHPDPLPDGRSVCRLGGGCSTGSLTSAWQPAFSLKKQRKCSDLAKCTPDVSGCLDHFRCFKTPNIPQLWCDLARLVSCSALNFGWIIITIVGWFKPQACGFDRQNQWGVSLPTKMRI